MICCVIAALFLVNLAIFGRKILKKLGIRKAVIEEEFIQHDPVLGEYYVDEFGEKILLQNGQVRGK
jgi:hypothetical protein